MIFNVTCVSSTYLFGGEHTTITQDNAAALHEEILTQNTKRTQQQQHQRQQQQQQKPQAMREKTKQLCDCWNKTESTIKILERKAADQAEEKYK